MKDLEELKHISTIPESSREYESEITRFSLKHMEEEDIEELKLVMDDSASCCGFEAFYCLATIYRHQKNYSKLSALIQMAESRESFKNHASLKHIRIMYETHSESLYDYDSILRLAHESACELPDNSGYQHTFANVFATICENCLQEDLDSIISEWYDPALYCVNRAIELERDYAKFYSTKARIVSLKNHYDEADRLIRQAIDQENSNSRDYPLIIGNYQYYRIMNAIRRQQWLLQAQRITHEAEPVDAVSGNYHPMHSYVFVSYSHDDRSKVYSILEKMKRRSINYWYDGEIPGGLEWADEIGHRLIDSHVVIVMVSHTALLSKNVRNEITMAQNHRKKIIPVYIERVELSPGAELQLQGVNSLYYYEMSEALFMHKLLSSVAETVIIHATDGPSDDITPKQRESIVATESKGDGRVEVIEQLCESKTGDIDLNEDIIVANDDFVAVFDGATSKGKTTFKGETGGRLAARFLAGLLGNDCLISSSNAIDGRTAVRRMQAALRRYAAEIQLEEPGVHMAASGVIYSIARRQIWAVGDCQFMIDGTLYTFPKEVDRILSEARALSIHMFMSSGYTEEQLMEDDKGRAQILDELRMQASLENKSGEYGYTVFSSGGELQTIVIVDVLPGSEVVLASDGYPVLYATLEESEYHLRELLRNDPLCYKEYKSTKGLSAGNAYVDDRSYIRFRVNE